VFLLLHHTLAKAFSKESVNLFHSMGLAFDDEM
jgi:hypothetical protein